MQLKLRHLYEAAGLGATWLASYSGLSVRGIQERLKSDYPNEKLVELNQVLAFLVGNGKLPDDCLIAFPDDFLDRMRSLQQAFGRPYIDMCQKQLKELESLRNDLEKSRMETIKASVDTSQKETASVADLHLLAQYVVDQLAIRDERINKLVAEVFPDGEDFVDPKDRQLENQDLIIQGITARVDRAEKRLFPD